MFFSILVDSIIVVDSFIFSLGLLKYSFFCAVIIFTVNWCFCLCSVYNAILINFLPFLFLSLVALLFLYVYSLSLLKKYLQDFSNNKLVIIYLLFIFAYLVLLIAAFPCNYFLNLITILLPVTCLFFFVDPNNKVNFYLLIFFLYSMAFCGLHKTDIFNLYVSIIVYGNIIRIYLYHIFNILHFINIFFPKKNIGCVIMVTPIICSIEAASCPTVSSNAQMLGAMVSDAVQQDFIRDPQRITESIPNMALAIRNQGVNLSESNLPPTGERLSLVSLVQDSPSGAVTEQQIQNSGWGRYFNAQREIFGGSYNVNNLIRLLRPLVPAPELVDRTAVGATGLVGEFVQETNNAPMNDGKYGEIKAVHSDGLNRPISICSLTQHLIMNYNIDSINLIDSLKNSGKVSGLVKTQGFFPEKITVYKRSSAWHFTHQGVEISSLPYGSLINYVNMVNPQGLLNVVVHNGVEYQYAVVRSGFDGQSVVNGVNDGMYRLTSTLNATRNGGISQTLQLNIASQILADESFSYVIGDQDLSVFNRGRPYVPTPLSPPPWEI